MAQGKVTAETKNGCYNRPPFKPFYLAKNGYSADGRQRFERVPHVMTTECVTGQLGADPHCDGCRWKTS